MTTPSKSSSIRALAKTCQHLVRTDPPLQRSNWIVHLTGGFRIMGGMSSNALGNKWLALAAPAFCLLAVFAMVCRLQYGVDFSDEGFYAALAKTFAQGRKPFLDELSSAQAFAILLVPPVKMFLWWNGSSEGIVIFLRALYLLALGATSACAYFCLRQNIQKSAALLTATLLMSFWPFTIPSLSYNTMGAIFTTLGLIALLRLGEHTTIGSKFPVALTSFGLATFCYPTLIAPLFLASLTFLFLTRDSKWQLSARIFTGFVVFCAIFLGLWILFVYSDLGRFKDMFIFAKSFGVQGGGAEKLHRILSQTVDYLPFTVLLTGGIWIVLAVASRQLKFGILCAIVWSLLLFAFPTSRFHEWPAHVVVFSTSLIALPAWRRYRDRAARPWIALATLAPILGFVCAWTSSNGLTNYAIGAAPGILTSGWYVANAAGRRGETLACTLLAILVTYQIHSLYEHAYGEDWNLSRLHSHMDSGPYRFLKTSEKKIRFSKELERDIARTDWNTETVAFLESFAAGYLFTDLRPLTPALWTYSLAQFHYDRDWIAKSFENPLQRPDKIFWLNSFPLTSDLDQPLENDFPDPLKEVIAREYEQRSRNAYYSIFVKKPK